MAEKEKMQPDMEAAQKLIELSVDDAEEERSQSRSRPNMSSEEGEMKVSRFPKKRRFRSIEHLYKVTKPISNGGKRL
ncbi:hypothetical protein QJS04_geneDACA019918 [Acorus gramineus]|uniref:Uncharacterized protein n=1 Tax=Acorus gramineus TaxID=55184 RepID=A0AAV9AJD3_ACOGR|nr:hypothetical protein QJS04_geneDACA019918 [Acorus gramineus]